MRAQEQAEKDAERIYFGLRRRHVQTNLISLWFKQVKPTCCSPCRRLNIWYAQQKWKWSGPFTFFLSCEHWFLFSPLFSSPSRYSPLIHLSTRHLGLDLVPRKEFEMVDPDQISISELYKLVSRARWFLKDRRGMFEGIWNGIRTESEGVVAKLGVRRRQRNEELLCFPLRIRLFFFK